MFCFHHWRGCQCLPVTVMGTNQSAKIKHFGETAAFIYFKDALKKRGLTDCFFHVCALFVHWHWHISTIWSQYEAGSAPTASPAASPTLMGAEVEARCSDRMESLDCGWAGRAWERTAYNCTVLLNFKKKVTQRRISAMQNLRQEVCLQTNSTLIPPEERNPVR